MIRVLVTGSNGQLGKTLQEKAASHPEIDFYFRNKETLNITLPQEVSRTFKEVKPEYCINCAAFTDVEQAEKTPKIAYDVNAEGVKNIALACFENRVKLIHISTDYVFDGEKEEGYYPDDKTNPINEYGKSKLIGEKYIQETLKDYLIIRTSWLYSKKHGNNFFKTILAKALKGESLRVTDEQVGCPTDANHLASYIVDCILREPWISGIEHCTDKKAMTWFDFACSILKKHDLDNKVNIVRDKNYRSFASRPKTSILLPKPKIIK